MGDSLYYRLGGSDAVSAVVDEFYDRVLSDDELTEYFRDVSTMDLRKHQKEFIAMMAGGPDEYGGRDVRNAHAHLGITDRDFGRVAKHLDDSMKQFDVPESERSDVLEAVGGLQEQIVTA